ncbi:DUF4384 domain-containing protein [Desulfococcaceae bacterium HSG8]|nr:DUF4384 domain-containing protein [Desulfococcaceae bacterium HSG8]
MKQIMLILLLIFPLFSPHHAQAGEKEWGVFWNPPFLPLTLHVGTDGVELSASPSIATPLGTFGLEFTADLAEKERPARVQATVTENQRPARVETVVVEKKDLLLVIRHPGKWGDKIYKITNGNEISVFTNGQTLILAKNGTVIVDVSKGDVTEIKLAGKQEILGGSVPRQAVANKTIPMELKIFYRDNDMNMFKSLRNGDRLRSGDLYKLAFKTPENAHVYIFNTDEAGKSVRLFPMTAFKGVTVNNQNPVRRGKTRYAPSPEKSFRLDTHIGTGKIWYIAMKQRDPRLESPDFQEGKAGPVQKYLNSLCRKCVSVISFEHR